MMKYLLFLFLSINFFAQNINFSTEKINSLNSLLENNQTNAFIIYQNGKIVNEKYFGKTFGNQNFTENSYHYWASAGKSLTAVLVGIAQQKGFLHINDKISKFLGKNWSSMTVEQEEKITVFHLLTMTSGFNYLAKKDCIDPECLQYKNDPGKVWFYHNSSYYLLEKVLEKAVGKDLNEITEAFLSKQINLDGKWRNYNGGKIYFSTAKSMLNFGKLVLGKGNFEGKIVYENDDYFKQMLNSSQELNPSYGFLWWLNGKNAIVLPSLKMNFKQALDPFAPKDLVAALGKNGQFLDIVPSENLILIRMGDNPDSAQVPVKFHRKIWEQIMK